VQVDGCKVSFFVEGDMSEAIAVLARSGVRELTSRQPSLGEVFLGLYEEPAP
jgi:hypothetical protein